MLILETQLGQAIGELQRLSVSERNLISEVQRLNALPPPPPTQPPPPRPPQRPPPRWSDLCLNRGLRTALAAPPPAGALLNPPAGVGHLVGVHTPAAGTIAVGDLPRKAERELTRREWCGATAQTVACGLLDMSGGG